MDDQFDRLMEEKRASDLRQRRITLIIVLASVASLLVIFFSVTRTRHANESLAQKLDTTLSVVQRTDSISAKLKDSLTAIKKELNISVIECFGKPNGQTSRKGLQEYDFTIRIKDPTLVKKLERVEYYFADPTYNPNLKTSSDAHTKFGITLKNSWGCMTLVPVYLHFLTGETDTINFPMCEKSRIILPAL